MNSQSFECSSLAIEVKNVTKSFGLQTVLNGVNLKVSTGQIVGLVGQSGCGKSTLAKIVAGLEEADDGWVFMGGTNEALPPLDARNMATKRSIQFIFQDAFSSFNPKRSIFDSIAVPFKVHHIVDHSAIKREIDRLFARVDLATSLGERLPHQLSGGQLQRAAIARAIACKPLLLLADEPTSALDLTTRSTILKLLAHLATEDNMACLIISHDLKAIAKICKYLYIMHRGNIVEKGKPDNVLINPAQRYTKQLVQAIPSLDPRVRTFAS